MCLNCFLDKACVFNNKSINIQNAGLDKITLGQSSPDILSGPSIHSCLIPAKTCSVLAKQLLQKYLQTALGPDPHRRFLERNHFLPCHSSPEPSKYRGHSGAARLCRLPCLHGTGIIQMLESADSAQDTVLGEKGTFFSHTWVFIL